MYQQRICTACNGAGGIRINDIGSICTFCNGTGKINYSFEDKIKELGEQSRKNHSFRTKVANWLEPLGYVPIWSDNHPSEKQDKVHYSYAPVRGKSVRIVSEKQYQDEYCYLMYEFYFQNEAFATKTCKFGVGTDLTPHIRKMDELIDSLPKNTKDISKLFELKETDNNQKVSWFKNLLYKWFGFCAVHGWFMYPKRFKMNTAYVDDEANYSYGCKECQRDCFEYYKERWDEYYANIL